MKIYLNFKYNAESQHFCLTCGHKRYDHQEEKKKLIAYWVANPYNSETHKAKGNDSKTINSKTISEKAGKCSGPKISKGSKGATKNRISKGNRRTSKPADSKAGNAD